ncbi:MAG TPA: hypothetical protein ENL21_08005 [Caldithrix abyssi]|uniref:T9SS type A sorting domain-containing protein n=1 Tax=Caldithrix abyssi TaxID=187145 RepID=A0A7V5H4I0_CALAY|nr:hypothetical protein [Caldithrix abyssi]
MKLKLFSLIFVLAIVGSQLLAQAMLKKSFSLAQDEHPFANTLYGNGIVDIVSKDSVVWIATGYGLSKAVFNPQTNDWSWQSFTEKDYKGKGGVSAFGYMDEQTFWIATAFDTMTQASDESLPAGSGLSYTRDGGKTWVHVPQPVDSVNEPNYAPTTTVIQNLIYDLAFIDSAIWIASFGGGLRRSDDMGKSWRVVTTDGKFFSSLQNLNHRAFSLLAVNDTLWVGTAEGISKSSDNGQTWERFVFDAQNPNTISGNFVVALAYQPAANAVWAATIQAEDTSEFRAVSVTYNGGKTWQRKLVEEDIFAHNFAFYGQEAFVAADKGLYHYLPEKDEWEIITDIQDFQSGNEIFQPEYYSVNVQSWKNFDFVWLGNADGLAVKALGDATAQWRVFRSFVSTKIRKEQAVYAYPVPFSPSRHLYVRFEYDSDQSLDEPIRIYDFAMDLVKEIPQSNLKPKWDGTNFKGDVVASGVYFFRAKVNGKVTWGKIVVVN